MELNEDEIEQLERKAIPIMAKRFWLLYIGSLLLAVFVSYHNVFTVLPSPVVENGITMENHEVYRAGMYSRGRNINELLFARKIKFTWHDKTYEIMGGWDEEMERGVPVKVVFNASHPERALELSLPGLLDFRVFRWAITFWIFFSGFVYAFASSDSHFTAFNFNIPRLTAWSFIFMLVTILLIPLYSSADLLLFGKKADGIMADHADEVNGSFERAIVFTADGIEYSAYSSYADEYEKKTGNHFSILYRPDNPNRCCVYQLGALYSNKYTIVMGISLIFLTGWLYSSVIFTTDK